jgi:hypothetical protein
MAEKHQGLSPDVLAYRTVKDNMVMYQKGKKRFVPDSSIREMICERKIDVTLKSYNSWNVDIALLRRFICDKATIIFAILIWMQEATVIEHFYRTQFTDNMLPVTYGFDHDDDDDDDNPSGISPATEKMPDLNLEVIRNAFNEDVWNISAHDRFCTQEQWSFLSPIFHDNTFEYQFHEQCHMPFMDSHPMMTKDTNFSSVEKWRIHRDHLRIGCRIVSLVPLCFLIHS